MRNSVSFISGELFQGWPTLLHLSAPANQLPPFEMPSV